jgi:transcriptional regulator with XRE-family HTH domain
MSKGPWHERFAKRLYEATRSADLTQRALAKELHLSESAVSRWFGGHTLPTVENLAEICKVTGAKASWLLELSDDAPKPRRGVDAAGVRQLVREVQRLRERESEAIEKVLAILQRERS